MARLRGVHAVNQSVVWVSGNNGTFGRTIDGGKTWRSSLVPEAEDLDFRDVHAFDADTAYLLSIGEGEKSRIYKTADGGLTWVLQFRNTNPAAFFDCFAFWDANSGVAFSDPVDGKFLIIRTTDAGATWNEVPRENIPAALPGEAAFAASGTCVSVFGADHAWIGTGGSASRVLRSTDRGRSWSAAATPIAGGSPSSGIYSIAFFNALDGAIVGGDYLKERESGANFARTADGGQTWIPGPSLPGYRSAVSYISREGRVGLLAVGPSGSDYLAPGANSWASIDSAGYHATSFLPSLAAGWAVGESGSIAKWSETLP